MRLVLRNAKTVRDGVLVRSDVVIEDGLIQGLYKRFDGPYDEAIDLNGMIIIPGLVDSFVPESEFDPEGLVSSGITAALVHVSGRRREFVHKSRAILSRSLVDVGFRTNEILVEPDEAFGYVTSNEAFLRLLRDAYGSVNVAIPGSSRRSRLLASKARLLGHVSILVDPRYPFLPLPADVVAVSLEAFDAREPGVLRDTLSVLRKRESGYLVTFGRYRGVSAGFVLTILLRGLATRRLLDRMTSSMRRLGLDYGILPGSRANLVALKREPHEESGLRILFRTYYALVGGRLVFEDGSIVDKPEPLIINACGPRSYV